MKQIQKGFTLIELMIVVAIIGILAAVAIPSYQDYTARAQASEAMMLGGGLRTAMAEWYADNGSMPTGPGSISGTTTGKYISTVTFADVSGGTVDIAMTFKSGVNAGIKNSVFAMATIDGGKNWECGESTNGGNTNTVLAKYLPGACK